VPVFLEARNRAILGKALPATLAFFVLRLVNSVFFVSAVWNEVIVGRRLATYEKGH
jgi:hypothetical protein